MLIFSLNLEKIAILLPLVYLFGLKAFEIIVFFGF